MFNARSTSVLSAFVSYGLENNPLSGQWLDSLERGLEQQWRYQPVTDFQPVFLLGVPQSGADLLYPLLCQHCPEIAYFALGQLSIVDHYLLSDLWMDSLRGLIREEMHQSLTYNLQSPESGLHEFLAMCNHPLVQGRYGLAAVRELLIGQEDVILSRHREFASYLQQLNDRIREGQPENFLNRYQVNKFREAVQKSVFTWRRRKRPVQLFLGTTAAASLSPRLFSYLFPSAKFIHLARAPQQALSAFTNNIRPLSDLPLAPSGTVTEKVLASCYGVLTGVLNHEIFDLPNPVLHLTYEQLQAQPAVTLARLAQFLELPDTLATQTLLTTASAVTSAQRIEEFLATYAPEAAEYYTHSQAAALADVP